MNSLLRVSLRLVRLCANGEPMRRITVSPMERAACSRCSRVVCAVRKARGMQPLLERRSGRGSSRAAAQPAALADRSLADLAIDGAPRLRPGRGEGLGPGALCGQAGLKGWQGRGPGVAGFAGRFQARYACMQRCRRGHAVRCENVDVDPQASTLAAAKAVHSCFQTGAGAIASPPFPAHFRSPDGASEKAAEPQGSLRPIHGPGGGPAS